MTDTPDDGAMSPTEPMPPADRHQPGTLDEQGRLLCTSPRKNHRGPCDQPAITGFDKCRLHVGKSVAQCRSEVKDALARLTAAAVGVAADLLLDPDTPHAVRARLAIELIDIDGHRAARRVDVAHVDLTEAAARLAAAQGIRDDLAERRAERDERGTG